MSSIEPLSLSPVKSSYFPVDIPPMALPFGGSTAFNALNYFLGTPDIVTKVEIF
jgi:hypothetical protein